MQSDRPWSRRRRQSEVTKETERNPYVSLPCQPTVALQELGPYSPHAVGPSGPSETIPALLHPISKGRGIP